MIFVRSAAFSGTAKNLGKQERSAFATTNSEGGMAGFMVRSQLRKHSQTCAVWLITVSDGVRDNALGT